MAEARSGLESLLETSPAAVFGCLLVACFMNYVFCAFVGGNLNPVEWHWALKAVSVIVFAAEFGRLGRACDAVRMRSE